MRLFDSFNFKFTCYAVGRALEHNPAAGKAMVEAGHEVASHGYRWINYQHTPEDEEREHISKSIDAIIQSTGGVAPVGWYTGRISPNTRRLVVEEYRRRQLPLLYDSDAYNDELPYYVTVSGQPLLVIPYTLDCNDMKFCVPPGFTSTDGFFQYLKDTFDFLYNYEGDTCPKIMNIGLHCRLVGKPGRIMALQRFMEYIHSKPQVWVATRRDIATHWIEKFPYQAPQAAANV
eukprot:TRINITY_DN4671_c0_g1_i8.p1 TRINITY_DN4671_c0_g1~~TRINITY_DN4671_c0_g1_i8.p1  ORF type:complete len:232 (-),score=72.08 TRINITY_DN4671_c0_g1_i8:130-825(-)